MALTTNTAPFWDDYDEKKQYYRILFRPGYPVQARELTQLQSALQKQIEHLGKHFFVHGSRVLGGEFAYNKCKYIKLADYVQNDTTSIQGLVDVYRAFSNTTLQGAKVVLDDSTTAGYGPGNYSVDSDGFVVHEDGRAPMADVILVAPREDTEPPTLLINYTSSGDTEFRANDYIKLVGNTSVHPNLENFHAVVNASPTSAIPPTGPASYAAVSNGVFFITASTGGYFAYAPKQKIIIEKYTNTPTWKVGLKITESIVDEIEDATLYDNAQGVYQNYAPGAHRLKVALDLAKDPSGDGIAINPESGKDFVELFRVTGGTKTYNKYALHHEKVYNVLSDVMADRTFDESGNYIVNDFDCFVDEASSPPNSQLKVTLRPTSGKASAKAYIQGRQYEQTEPLITYIDKARNTTILREQSVSTQTGPYLTVKDLQVQQFASGRSAAQLAGQPFWDIHSANTWDVDTTNISKYNSTLVGRFRLRNIISGKQPNANLNTMFITDFAGSSAITGNFQDAPETEDLGPGAAEVSVVTVQAGNTSTLAENAYAGGLIKITSTEELSQNNYVGQTRTVIKSLYNAGGTKLWLDAPFVQPASNTGAPDGFPGEGETYSLSLGLKSVGTGNGCIVNSGIGPGGFGTLISDKTANAALIAGTTQSANTNPIVGGYRNTYNATLLYNLGTGGGYVANTLSSTITDSDIVLYAVYDKGGINYPSGGPAVFNPTHFRETTGYNISEFASFVKRRWVIINETTGLIIPPDDFDLVQNGVTAEITSSVFASTGDKLRAIAPVRLGGIKAKSKTLKIGNNTKWDVDAALTTDRTTNGHVVFASPNVASGGKDNLGMVDVYKVREIYDTGNPEFIANGLSIGVTSNKVTQNYILDVGQREDMYDYASLVLKPGARPPRGQLIAVVDWFTHSETGTTDVGFFSIDSYNGSGVGVEDIPSFSTNEGRRISLKDHLDFRPSRAMNVSVYSTGTTDTHNTGAAANTNYFVNVVSIPTDSASVGTDGGGVSAAGKAIFTPDPLGAVFFDMQVFAPRIDKIILSLQRSPSSGANTGHIRFVSGSKDQVPPIGPIVNEHDMELFSIGLPAYTFSSSHVNVKKANHRRWTMKDITKISEKIKRLEYHSSLNMIEQELNNLTIYDSENNLERFKNGFLVDTFQMGTAVADVGIPGAPNFDFNASIGRGLLRPAIAQENISLEPSEAHGDHIQVSWADCGTVVHLPYTIDRSIGRSGITELGPPGLVSRGGYSPFWSSVEDFSQLNATDNGAENVNPFQLQNFQGQIKCSPASDNWRSTVDAAVPLMVDTSGARSAIRTFVDELNLAEENRMAAATSFEWGEWDENWYGNPDVTTETFNTFHDPDHAMRTTESYISDQPGVVTSERTVELGGNWHNLGDGNYSLGPGSYWPSPIKSSYEGFVTGGLNVPSGSYWLSTTDFIQPFIASDNPFNWNGLALGAPIPVMTHVFDDAITTTVISGDQTRTGTGLITLADVQTDRIQIGEFSVNSSVAQFMRPIDIKFSADGLKPMSKYFPFFDDDSIMHYVERANELVVKLVSGTDSYDRRNFLGGLNEQEKLMSTSEGRGLAIGSTGNTYFIVSANGSFKVGDVITGDISNTGAKHAIDTVVVSYKSYSGSVQETSTGAELKLDDSAKDSSSPWMTTSENDRAYTKVGGSFDVDLYGKAIHITEGKGYGQSGQIIAYDSTTNKVTVGNLGGVDSAINWVIPPDTTSRYSIAESRWGDWKDFEHVGSLTWRLSHHRPRGVAAWNGGMKSSKYGSLHGVFHVPNYNWANRLQKASLEGNIGSDSEIYDQNNVESETLTNDTKRFTTGTHTIALRDHPWDTQFTNNGLQSQAKTNFQAAGVIETRQKWTRDVYGVSTYTEERTSSESRPQVLSTSVSGVVEVGTICHLDPLAQSFVVDAERHPEGVYVDSIDLWFKTRHEGGVQFTPLNLTLVDIPVTCQLRPTIAGVPHGGIVLGSSTLNSVDIKTSTGNPQDVPDPGADSANMTTFEFGRPIHLMPGQEYAIVIISNSDEYEVWTARIGAPKVGSGPFAGWDFTVGTVFVDRQPHTGSFFKSQNGSTWQPEPYQDLMFRVNICVFDTSKVGTMIWRTANTMDHYVPPLTRVPNPLGRPYWGVSEHQPTSQTWSAAGHKVWANNFVYDRFRVDTPTNNFGSTLSYFQYAATTEGVETPVDVPAINPTTGWRNLQLSTDVVPEIYPEGGLYRDAQRLTILKNKPGSFTLKGILSSTNQDVSPMINQERLSLTMMQNLINDGELSANTWPVNYILLDEYAGGNVVGGGFSITPGLGYSNEDIVTFRTERLTDTDPLRIGVGATGTLLTNAVGSIVGVTLTNAGNTYLQAPVITINDTGGTGGTGGAIEYVGEDSPRGPGNFMARYMTRRVVLADGFDSKDLLVYLTASQRPGTSVHVYAKVRSSEDPQPFNEKKWQLMARGQSRVSEMTRTESEFREVLFGGPGAIEYPFAYSNGDESVGADKFNTFNEFAIKIILQSNNPLRVPVVKNLRSIAVD